jgi:hypothetical protein
LLVDRTKHQNRDLIQLVLDEALKTAPKLTDAQLAVLGAIFLLRYVRFNVEQPGALASLLKSYLQPVLQQVEVTQSTFQHLEFTGCGATTPFAGANLTNIFAETYPALFQKGFTQEDLAQQNLPTELARAYVIPLPADASKLQVSILNNEVLQEITKKKGLDGEVTNKLNHLLVAYRLTPEEIKVKLLELAPFLKRAYELWERENLGTFTLTSVGIALGHSVVKKNVGLAIGPLGVWVK